MALLNDLYLSRKPLAAFAVLGFGWATYFAQMPVIKANLNVSDANYGMLVFVSAFGAVAAMLLAPFSARFFGRFSLVAGATAIGTGFILVGIAPTPFSFVCALALAAAGSGIIDVLASTRIAGIEADTKRSLMNLNHGFYSLSYAGAALLTGVAREASWSPLNVFSTLLVAIFILCFVMYGPDPYQDDDDATSGKTKLPTALVWITGIIVLMAFLTESVTEGWSALHIERTLGGGAGEGALGPAVLGLMMGIGRLSGHAVSKYVSDLTLMAVACGVSACGVALAAGAHTIGTAYLGFALGGLGISVVGPLAFGILGRMVPSNVRTLAISRASVIGYCAFFMGPALMGFVSEGVGLTASFYLVAGLLAVVVAILIPMLAKQMRNQNP